MSFHFLTFRLEVRCLFQTLYLFVIAPKFSAKTFLHRIYPGGYGYMNKLRTEANNIHAPDCETVIGKLIRKNGYESYEQYISHQSSKLDAILYKHGGFSSLLIMRWRLVFFTHFKPLMKLLNRNAKILCVGARQGTEVEVLQDIGFKNTKGCDLNPGPNNPYVYTDDFMKHNLPDNSVDAIYSNAIDHAYNLDLFFKEQARILKVNGKAIFDFAELSLIGGASDYESQSWKSTDEPIKIMKKYFPYIYSDIKNNEWRTIIAHQ
jgi:SAM-dependent methyltransferase